MEKIDRFNIRVYGLLIFENQLMILKEPYAGEILYKFPGGGLEFGEGVIECLEREFLEELNLKITKTHHFYTQEGFLASKFRKNEQLLTVYYMVEVESITELKLLDNSIEEVIWCDLNKYQKSPLILPIDQLVWDKLLIELD